MNPQANPYQTQSPAAAPMQGGFAMPPAGVGQYPMPPVPGAAPYGQPGMQPSSAGLPPVPMQAGIYQQAPAGMPHAQGAAMPALPQQHMPVPAQPTSTAVPTAANQTPTQAAVLATKQAIAQYANNPYEMVQAVQRVRSTYLAQQYNLTDKSAE